jgi:hypothetical protein
VICGETQSRASAPGAEHIPGGGEQTMLRNRNMSAGNLLPRLKRVPAVREKCASRSFHEKETRAA